jgi:hypothetical protein
MRLSDAVLRQRQTKTLYPNHRLPPWLTDDAARDRSNRLLEDSRLITRAYNGGRCYHPTDKLDRRQSMRDAHNEGNEAK